MEKHAPWYEIAGRFLLVLTTTAVSYAVLILHLCGVAVICDELMDSNIQELVLNLCEQYPTESIVITVIGYIVWTGALIYEFINRLGGRKLHGL